MTKKNAEQLVQDIINGQLTGLEDTSHSESTWQAASEAIQANYEFTEDQFKSALIASRSQIESAVGTPLTDEQLAAVAGGKGWTQTDTIAAGSVGGAVGVGTAVGATVGAIAFFVIFK
jgi:hypothetical protein